MPIPLCRPVRPRFAILALSLLSAGAALFSVEEGSLTGLNLDHGRLSQYEAQAKTLVVARVDMAELQGPTFVFDALSTSLSLDVDHVDLRADGKFSAFFGNSTHSAIFAASTADRTVCATIKTLGTHIGTHAGTQAAR